jgi:hypothetical protein
MPMLKIIGKIAFQAWTVLCVLINIFLVDHLLHPHVKGISDIDLLEFLSISFCFLGIAIISKLIVWINCDATMLNRSTEAGNKILLRINYEARTMKLEKT